MIPLRCPGQDPRFLKAQDIAEMQCPDCGRTVEFWPDELLRKCPGCSRRLANPENSMKCLAWCRYAAQCLAAISGESGATIAPLREELVERMRKAFGDDVEKTDHALAVLNLAEDIGRQEGGDPLVLVPAAILSDIGPAAEILAEVGLPQAVQEEILETIAHREDRDKVHTPSGAALFDAVLIVSLQDKATADAEAVLAREALTDAGRRIGAARLAQWPSSRHDRRRQQCR